MVDSILNINVSSFENCQSTIPKDICLLSWLTNDRFKAKVIQLRAIQDEDLQKVIKASLPAITPSGVFSYRAEKNLMEHSGFMVFDIDFKENQHITDFMDLREQISHIESVAYCGLSVRGKGFWGLVPIPKSTPDIHKQRFAALANDFKEFGIALDTSGKDVCRLRIYSWDPDAYFNHDAKIYTKLLKPQPKITTRPAYSNTRERIEAIISQIKENKIDITQDYKEEWLKIASALANEFNESGRGYFHTISQYNNKYSVQDTDKMYDNVLKHDYNKISIASFFKIANDYGIKIQEGQRKGEIRKPSDNQYSASTKKELADIGIRRKEFSITNLPKIETIIKPGIWSNEISELETFFSSVKLPDTIRLNQCSTITDVSLFVESNLAFVRSHNGNMTYKSYMNQLTDLKTLLNSI